MRRRLQNSIAESALTLPVAGVLATLLWWLPQGAYSTAYLQAWLSSAVMTFFVIETTNANSLLRVRSQMIAALLLFALAVCGFLHAQYSPLLCMLGLMLTFYSMLQTVPQSSSVDSSRGRRVSRRPQVATFHAFLFLSLGSIEWPPMLLLALPLLLGQGVFLQSLSWRCLGAAFIGMVLPYFFWSAAAFTLDNFPPFVAHAEAIIAPVSGPIANVMAGQPLLSATYQQWMLLDSGDFPAIIGPWVMHHLPRLTALVFVVLLALTGFIYYYRNSYDDKIRVRACHHFFLMMMVVIMLWLAAQPRHYEYLFPMLLLMATPSAAHFVAHTHTWFTNAWFVILSIFMVVVGICNLVPGIEQHLYSLSDMLQQILMTLQVASFFISH